jgi:RHS repeat-associated protein
MADNYGATTSYAYDAEDRVTSITTPWGQPITQSYDAAGRPLRLAYPNGLDADLSFESGTGRLAGILHRAGSLATPIAQFLHSYDARGDLATLTERSKAKSFVYDKIERLIDVMQTSVATPVESYAYDTEGNRTASHLSPNYVTDPANRVLDDGTNSYTWSPNGAMTSRTPKAGGSGLNFQNSWHGLFNQVRLDAISGVFPMRFSYDPQGRMAARAFDYDPSLGVQDRYHDGDAMVLELRNRGGATPQWVRYVHGAGIDQPLAMEIYPAGALPTPGTGSQYYYHADGEGSIRLLTDANGQTANQYEYDSYGQRLTAVESAPQPFAWKGREWVPGPDLYFNRARFYDPQLGRFTSEDPLGYDGNTSNFYSFVGNSPPNWNDPSGLAAAAAIQPRAGGGPAAEYAGLAAAEFEAAGAQLQTALRLACNLMYIASVLDTPDGFTLAGRNGCAGIFIAAVTSPEGRKGNPDHQAKVEQLKQECRDRGGEPTVKEKKVDIPGGGFKKSRFPDVTCIERDGFETLYNVARKGAGGNFVARERQAFWDFVRAHKQIFLVAP